MVQQAEDKMKLKEFNTNTIVSERFCLPTISLEREKGLFTVSKQAAELIELTDGNQIAIYQDENEPENWFIEKVKNLGFTLKRRKDNQPTLQFNNSALARKVIDGMNGNGKLRLLVAGKPTMFQNRKLWGLLKRHIEK